MPSVVRTWELASCDVCPVSTDSSTTRFSAAVTSFTLTCALSTLNKSNYRYARIRFVGEGQHNTAATALGNKETANSMLRELKNNESCTPWGGEDRGSPADPGEPSPSQRVPMRRHIDRFVRSPSCHRRDPMSYVSTLKSKNPKSGRTGALAFA